MCWPVFCRNVGFFEFWPRFEVSGPLCNEPSRSPSASARARFPSNRAMDGDTKECERCPWEILRSLRQSQCCTPLIAWQTRHCKLWPRSCSLSDKQAVGDCKPWQFHLFRAFIIHTIDSKPLLEQILGVLSVTLGLVCFRHTSKYVWIYFSLFQDDL